MTIHQLQFLTDENIDPELVQFLRNHGFDVLDIKEQGWFSLPDRKILDTSFLQKRVVISQDSGFGTLIFRDKQPVCGVFYLRPGHVSPDVHIQTMKTILIAKLDYVFPFIAVAENMNGYVKIRLRQI